MFGLERRAIVDFDEAVFAIVLVGVSAIVGEIAIVVVGEGGAADGVILVEVVGGGDVGSGSGSLITGIAAILCVLGCSGDDSGKRLL